MPNLKKVLIVELSPGHLELIPSHLYVLKKRKYKVYFAGFDKNQDALAKWQNSFSESIYISKPKNLKQLLSIRQFIQRHNIGQVLFNSASGRTVLLLSIIIPPSIHLCGVLHDVEKLKKSNTQKIISLQVKNYFVLSNYLLRKANAISSGLFFQFFYPIYYGSYERSETQEKRVKVVIPGNVQLVRRDYIGFIKALASINKQTLKNIRIVLLGNISQHDGAVVRNLIEKLNLGQVFEFYKCFIPDNEFHQTIVGSDYVMPLTHPSVFQFNKYDEYKISGAYNLAFGHKKPLLMHEELKRTQEFNDLSLFYNLENIQGLFDLLTTTNSKVLVSHYDREKRFQERDQEERFFSIVK